MFENRYLGGSDVFLNAILAQFSQAICASLFFDMLWELKILSIASSFAGKNPLTNRPIESIKIEG